MYRDKKILALIPARGGSKGIKNKNIIPLSGKPLIAHTIECGLNSKYIDSVVVTTDSEKIAEVAMAFGARVPFLRPETLASDTAKTIDAVLHAVRTLREMHEIYDVLLLLQPTQPLRTSEDVDGAIETFFEQEQTALASVSPVDDHPLLIRTIKPDGRLEGLLNCSSTCRRQDMSKYYRINGCIYINLISELDEQTSFNDNPIPFVMEKNHSIDIDEYLDLAIAEILIDSIGSNRLK